MSGGAGADAPNYDDLAALLSPTLPPDGNALAQLPGPTRGRSGGRAGPAKELVKMRSARAKASGSRGTVSRRRTQGDRGIK